MLKNKWIKLDIQFFSSGGDSGADNKKETGSVTLTPEELQKKIESESDRKLESAKRKWEKDQESKTQQLIKDALEEQERLSKLVAKECKDEELNQREKDLEARLAKIERRELFVDAIVDLNEKKLPSSFAEILLAENAEKTFENINTFKIAFDAAVAVKVKEALRQDTPDVGS